jgi:hypothetical protein
MYANNAIEEQLLVSSYKNDYCTKLMSNVVYRRHRIKQSNVLTTKPSKSRQVPTASSEEQPQKTSLLQQAALSRSRFGDDRISDEGDSTRFLALSVSQVCYE